MDKPFEEEGFFPPCLPSDEGFCAGLQWRNILSLYPEKNQHKQCAKHFLACLGLLPDVVKPNGVLIKHIYLCVIPEK